MNRRDVIKGIGAAICAYKVPPFLPELIPSEATLEVYYMDILGKPWKRASVTGPASAFPLLSEGSSVHIYRAWEMAQEAGLVGPLEELHLPIIHETHDKNAPGVFHLGPEHV